MSNPVITPEILVTKSYKNKIIQFIPDERLKESSLVAVSAAGVELLRDISQFVVVTLNDPKPYIFRVEMNIRVLDRDRLDVIDTKFREL